MIRVLSVASECVPLVKTGGLADVVGALPKAVAPLGVDMRTLLPGYPAVMARIGKAKAVKTVDALFGGPSRLLKAALGDGVLYVLDAPHLFDRPGAIYLGPDGWDWPDNPERFAALAMMAATIGAEGIKGDKGWTPRILHLHDWQAGLAPVYLREMGAADRVGTVLTIHNIAFQGLVPRDRLRALALSERDYHPDGLEYYGQISALKAGLVNADRLTTVSPTYAAELMTPDFGMGLDGVLQTRRSDLTGIINGIDLDVWKPPYKTASGKTAHKTALRRIFELPDSPGPLAVVISRLTQQKGFDMLLGAVPGFLAAGGQLALLGSGDPHLENAFLKCAHEYAGVGIRIGYDEELSRKMIAGADAILVPSRFEPCGLTQLYGLRFGTIPVVTMTGGLADTVIHANAAALAAGVATGLQVFPVTQAALAHGLSRLCDLFADKTTWAKMQKNAMAQPVGWDASAAQYVALYHSMTAA